MRNLGQFPAIIKMPVVPANPLALPEAIKIIEGKTMTRQEILDDLAAVESKFQLFKDEKQQAKINDITCRLKTTADQLQHAHKSAAFVAFKEAEAYIEGLKAEIAATGTTAINIVTGAETTIKFNPDGTTAKTFGILVPGATVTISGSPYLVTSFDQSYAGSSAELLYLGSKADIVGQKKTPYSGFSCAFDHGTKVLTVANSNRLQPNQIVTISGVQYKPSAIIGDQKHFSRYEMVVVSNELTIPG